MTVEVVSNDSAYPRSSRGRKGNLELKVLVALTIAVVVLAIIGPYIVVHDPTLTNADLAYSGPSWEYPLGCDNLGRCMLCRIVAGLRSAVFSGVVVVAAAFAIGTVLGIVAGYYGGIVDRIVMWLITSFQVFPSFLLAVVIAGFLGTGIENACIALIVVYWTTFARMSRSLVLSLKERTFVKASRLTGAGSAKTLFKHILPNISSYMLVIATGDIGSVVLSMSGLSYLGLGATRPTSDWGVMLSDLQSQVFLAPHLMIEVGVCLSLLVLLFTLLGDKLRDYFDSRGGGGYTGRISRVWREYRRSKWGLSRKGKLEAVVEESQDDG